MSTDLLYDFSANERMQRHMQALASLDLSVLAEELSFEGEQQTRRRIQSEKTAPDGSAWPEWSEQYAATRHGGQSLLQGEGDLLDSIQSNPEGDVASWGSNLVYAALQNFGGEEVGINVEAREYLGLSSDNLDDIEHLVIDWIDRNSGAVS